MSKRNFQFLVFRGLLIIFCFCLAGTTFGQLEKKPIQANNDSLFMTARKVAFDGNRAKARSICFDIVRNHTTYVDAWILIGRTYTWDHQYDSARIAFNEVLSKAKENYDANDAMIDLEYWSDQYEACIRQCNNGLYFHANDKNFLLKKAKAMIAIKEFSKAKLLLEDVAKTDPVNTDIPKLLQAIRNANMKNKMTLNYGLDYFEKRMIAPWHMAYLQYSRKTSIGTLTGRINFANRFGESGLQAEADAYPKLTKTTYLYLNLGYSAKDIFPHFRSGGEIYKKLPKAFETSLGYRFLSFTSSDVVIYTGSIGKYIGNYWLSARTFVTPDNIGTSVSGMLMTRRYFADQDTYLGIRVSYGTSPDDRKELLTSTAVLRVKSEALRMEYNKKINKVWIVNLAASCENEEYYPDRFRYIFSADLTFSLLF